MKEFAGILSYQLLHLLDDINTTRNYGLGTGGLNVNVDEGDGNLSELTRSSGESTLISVSTDLFGSRHELMELPTIMNWHGKKYTKTKACSMCLKKTVVEN